MYNWRTFVNSPAGDDPAATDYIGAKNINNFLGELENSVTRSGQSLGTDDGTDDSNKLQLAESMFLHGVKSQGFVDSGSANTYEVTPISGASGVKIPADYSNVDGATVWFVPANASTADSTLNIGQTSGSLLGAKKLLNNDGSAITTEIAASGPIEVRYDSSADGGSGAWLLQPWSNISEDTDSFSRMAQVQHVESSGVDGSNLTSNTWATRPLNTEIQNDIPGLVFDTVNYEIDLPVGTFDIEVDAVLHNPEFYRTRVYDVTNSTVLFYGMSGNGTPDSVNYPTFLRKRFTVASPISIRIDHVSSANATNGMGTAGGFADEIYADVRIWEIS